MILKSHFLSSGRCRVTFGLILGLFNTEIDKFPLLLGGFEGEIKVKKRPNYSALIRSITEQYSDLDSDDLKEFLQTTVSGLNKIIRLDTDQRIGLMMHLAALVNRLVHEEKIAGFYQWQKLLESNRKMEAQIRQILNRFESIFRIHFPDCEIASIIKIMKKV